MKPYNKLTNIDKDLIIQLYYENKSFKNISSELNVSARAIPRVLKESGINTHLKNRYTLNSDYFENIDTEEKAYWLGFIYADGYVGDETKNNLVILLNEDDYSHLEKFKEAIEYTGKIRNAGKGGYPGSRERYAINFSDKKMTSDLRKIGLYPNKSLTIDKIPTLNENLIRHFIRGYFDGDGSIYSQISKTTIRGKLYSYDKLMVSIIGTQPFLEDIKSHMPFYFSIKDSVTKEMKYLIFHGVNDMKDIYNFFYKDSSIFLDRKYNKFTQLIGPLTP